MKKELTKVGLVPTEAECYGQFRAYCPELPGFTAGIETSSKYKEVTVVFEHHCNLFIPDTLIRDIFKSQGISPLRFKIIDGTEQSRLEVLLPAHARVKGLVKEMKKLGRRLASF